MKNKFTKLAFALLLAAGGFTTVSAQVSQKVGLNPFNLTQSAAFEIESTTKGFLPSRLTLAERDAIVNPATGLVVYNKTSNLLEINVGTTAAPIWKSGIVLNPSIAEKTADYTALETDYTILCNTSTAGFTLTIPAAADAMGRVYVIKKVDESDNILTFSPALSLSTSATPITDLNFTKTIRIQSDGSNWNIID